MTGGSESSSRRKNLAEMDEASSSSSVTRFDDGFAASAPLATLGFAAVTSAFAAEGAASGDFSGTAARSAAMGFADLTDASAGFAAGLSDFAAGSAGFDAGLSDFAAGSAAFAAGLSDF